MSSDLTYVTNAGPRRAAIGGRRLLLVEGPDAPLEFELPAAGITIGHAADCKLRLTDKRVSRNHVHVMPDGEGFRVRDLGSTNGTFLNGARVDNAVAPAGATILVGKSTIKLVGGERVLRRGGPAAARCRGAARRRPRPARR